VVKNKVNGWLKPETLSYPSAPPEKLYISGYGSAMSVEKAAEEHSVQPEISPDDVPIYNSTFNLKDVKGGKWFLRMFLVVFISAGLVMTIFGVSNIRTAKDSETWPSKEGVILESKISINEGDDSTTYGADVVYEYEVKNQTYKGDKVTFGEVSTSSRSRARKVVRRYPSGKKIAVFYDPKDPETSVLETGLSGGVWLLPGIGLLFFLVPLGMLVHTEKSNRKAAQTAKGKKNPNSIDALQDRYGKVE
jgi:hypothetical protein